MRKMNNVNRKTGEIKTSRLESLNTNLGIKEKDFEPLED